MRFRLKQDIHATVRDNLSAYVDGEADAQTVAQIESHLATCRACSWEKETLERTRSLVAEAPRIAAPRSFALRQADVEAASQATRSQKSKMLYLRGATALVGVLLFAVVAGDAWLRPGMSGAPAADRLAETPAPELLWKGAEPLQFAPEGTPLAAEAPPPRAGEAVSLMTPEGSQEDAGLQPTASIASPAESTVPEPREARAPWWHSMAAWRAAEGALGLLFVLLLAVTITGARRVRQGI